MLLHIYDADDSRIAATAASRGGTDRVALAVTGRGSNLISGLDGLVGGAQSFSRVLFETHGSPGRLYFGGASIDSTWVSTNMAGRGYERLCPTNTRMYFNGCNVAASPGGQNFMRSMAQVFLTAAGGTVFGHTSVGYELPIYSWLTGHVVHFTGDLVTLYVAPGGRVLETYTQSDV